MKTEASESFDWRQIEACDYREYVANLRACGCPEPVIRDIITAEITLSYAPRAAQILHRQCAPYWQKSVPSQPTSRQLKDLQALEHEKRYLVEALLGNSYSDQELVNTLFLQLWGHELELVFLPPAKRGAALEALEQSGFADREALARTDDRCSQTPEQWFEEKARILSSVLSAEEMDEYRLRWSPAADRLRYNLQYFEYTRDEFRALLQATTHASTDCDPWDATPPLPELRGVLGEERVREFNRVTDFLYINTRQAAEEEGIPVGAVERAWEAIHQARLEKAALSSENKSIAERPQAELDRIFRKAEVAIHETLGPRVAPGICKQLQVVLMSVRRHSKSQTPPSPLPSVQPESRRPTLREAIASTKRALRLEPVETGPNVAGTSSQHVLTLADWSSIESADTREFAQNLRATGCPEQTVRDTVVLRTCRQFRKRLMEAEEAAARDWDFHRVGYVEMRERNRIGQALRNQLHYELESVFGVTCESLTSTILGWQPCCGGEGLASLTPEKKRSVNEIEQRHQEIMQRFERRRLADELNVEDRDRIAGLEKQKQAELANVLPPGELEDYLCRRSSAARYVRMYMPQAKSEAEFRVMVKAAIEAGVCEQMVSPFRNLSRCGRPPSEAAPADLQERLNRINQRLSEALGPERLLEQGVEERHRREEERLREEKRDREQGRAHLVAIAARIGIPEAKALAFCEKLEQLRPTVEKSIRDLENRLTGTPEAKQREIQNALREILTRTACETVGEKGRELVAAMAGCSTPN